MLGLMCVSICAALTEASTTLEREFGVLRFQYF